jgi:hypothetical protein
MVKRRKCIRCGGVMVNAYISVQRHMHRFGYVCRRCAHYDSPDTKIIKYVESLDKHNTTPDAIIYVKSLDKDNKKEVK